MEPAAELIFLCTEAALGAWIGTGFLCGLCLAPASVPVPVPVPAPAPVSLPEAKHKAALYSDSPHLAVPGVIIIEKFRYRCIYSFNTL